MMERAIGTTFKVGRNEIIVREALEVYCKDENGSKCFFYKHCILRTKSRDKAGQCVKNFRKDGKNVVFIKK